MTEYPVSDRFKVTLNGIDLSKWINVSDVQRNVGQNRKATLVKVGKTDGKLFQYTTADEGTITIKGDLDGDSRVALADKRHQLADAITTSSLAKLWFEDEPNTYYLAISDGQAVATEDQFLGEVTITFSVPDGLAHSLDVKSVISTSGSVTELVNAGSYECAPILSATMASDNGLVGWTNDQGAVLQFGAADEVDGEQHDDSQTVFHYDFLAAPSGVMLNAGTIAYPNYLGNAATPNKQVGTFDYAKHPDAATATYDRPAAKCWMGPSMSGSIGANSLGSNTGNFLWTNRFNVKTSVAALGRAEFTLTSSKKVVASIILRDSIGSADSLVLDCQFGNSMLYSGELNRKIFTNGFYEAQIRRLGDTITFQLGKIQTLTGGVKLTNSVITKTFTMSGFSDTAIDGFTAWFPGFFNTVGWGANWSDSLFEWLNVDYYVDIPNRYRAGDVVTADVATKTVYLNGVEAPELAVVGNQWDEFWLQPGHNSIMPAASSWASPFSAQIQWREAFV